jgi:4-amino-4-deoxychorismate lyase
MKFIESIRAENGSFKNLPLHQDRVNRTFKSYFPDSEPLLLDRVLPKIELDGIYKVRFIYDRFSSDIEFINYHPRTIQSLSLIDTPAFNYAFKFEDRTTINNLLKQSQTDEIIMCVDGLLTDSSYANIALYDGQHWFTPKSHLLNGVRRQQLLSIGKIKEATIKKSDIGAFQKISLINAMLDLEELVLPLSVLLKR